MKIWYVGFDCGHSAGSEQCSTLCVQGKRMLEGGKEERKEKGKKGEYRKDRYKERRKGSWSYRARKQTENCGAVNLPRQCPLVLLVKIS